MSQITVGLYGINGHQVHHNLINHPLGVCVAAAGIKPENLPLPIRENNEFVIYDSLEEMLHDDRIHLISLCSPRRRDQAQQAIMCMDAGKHVYAEKPCAMTEKELDEIMTTAAATGMSFHEMAGTAFSQPYYAMREYIKIGELGTIVQIFAQKSYPYHDRRPQDENVDGGLLLQVGVHALRFIEHVAGVKVTEIYALETQLGNPSPGQLRMAVSLMMHLENGGVASTICNYLNPPAFGIWGNESLRIFGTNGFIEAVDGGTKTRLVLHDQDCGPIKIDHDGYDYFDLYLQALSGQGDMLFDLEEELHPTRIHIRAKADADRRTILNGEGI
jgi:predicted dehydrogenase